MRIFFKLARFNFDLTLFLEPGYYEDGSYGIRIENVVVVRDAQTANNFGSKGYLRFEHVTLVRSSSLAVGCDHHHH